MATTLKVTFSNGNSICYRNSIDTVMAVFRGIEPSRLGLITLQAKGRRLFTQNVAKEDEPYAIEIGKGWYYIHKFQDTNSKFLHLYQINEVLGLGLKIEVVSTKLASDYKYREVRRNPGQQLKVVFDNNSTIEGLSCAETLSQFVKYIGVENVARRDLIWHGKKLITTLEDNSRRILLGDFRWIISPTNSKETSELIRFIATMTRNKCEVTAA